MKPSEAVGLIRHNRRFGRSKILSWQGGRTFRCQSLEKFPGVCYVTAWHNLTKKPQS